MTHSMNNGMNDFDNNHKIILEDIYVAQHQIVFSISENENNHGQSVTPSFDDRSRSNGVHSITSNDDDFSYTSVKPDISDTRLSYVLYCRSMSHRFSLFSLVCLSFIHRRVLPCSDVYIQSEKKITNSYLLSSDCLSDH